MLEDSTKPAADHLWRLKSAPCVYVSKLVNRCPMVAGFPREAIEFGRGSGKMSVGWRLLLLAVLSPRGWLPAPKGTVILAPLTQLGRAVVLSSLERPVVAAAITVGIALTSKPSQLSQQIAYSPARGLATVPGDGIVISVRAEYVVNHRTRLDVSLSPCILPYGRGDGILPDTGRKAVAFITIIIHSFILAIRLARK